LLRREINGDFSFTNGGAGENAPASQFPHMDPAAAGVALACGGTDVAAAVIDKNGNIVTSTFHPDTVAWTDWTAITKTPARRIGISASRNLAGKNAAVIWNELDESVKPAVWNVRGALLVVN